MTDPATKKTILNAWHRQTPEITIAQRFDINIEIVKEVIKEEQQQQYLKLLSEPYH